MFRLEQLSKHFGNVQALQGVDLHLRKGAVTALIGPSGAGKSTLFRLLLGLDWPDGGCLLVDGRPLVRSGLLHWRRQVGYAIQEGGLFPHLTAFDNVSLVARLLRWDVARIADRVDTLRALLRLPESALLRFPSQLSGGQRQRVALLRALMLDPPVLLLDEPLGALDPVVRRELQDELKSLFATLGKTVVLVTHDVAEACYLATQLVLLVDGGVAQQGSPDDLLRRPATPAVGEFMHAQRELPT